MDLVDSQIDSPSIPPLGQVALRHTVARVVPIFDCFNPNTLFDFSCQYIFSKSTYYCRNSHAVIYTRYSYGYLFYQAPFPVCNDLFSRQKHINEICIHLSIKQIFSRVTMLSYIPAAVWLLGSGLMAWLV
jgi:hypothetical protein